MIKYKYILNNHPILLAPVNQNTIIQLKKNTSKQLFLQLLSVLVGELYFCRKVLEFLIALSFIFANLKIKASRRDIRLCLRLCFQDPSTLSLVSINHFNTLK